MVRVSLNSDLGFPPDVADALDRGPATGQRRRPMLNPRTVVITLGAILVIIVVGVTLILLDHLLTRQPEPEIPEAVGADQTILFSDPRIGMVVADGVLYSGPGTNFAPLAQLRPETRVRVLGVKRSTLDDSWVVIELFGEHLTGWVVKRVVEY